MFLWIRLNSELLRYQGVQNFAKNNTENTLSISFFLKFILHSQKVSYIIRIDKRKFFGAGWPTQLEFPTGGKVRDPLCKCMQWLIWWDSGTDSKVWMREELWWMYVSPPKRKRRGILCCQAYDKKVRWTFFSILCHICCILCQKRHEIISML